jgi:hypothetical protein
MLHVQARRQLMLHVVNSVYVGAGGGTNCGSDNR